MKANSKISLDLMGMSASLLCAIHCAVMPFILTLSSLSSLHFLENALVEGIMLAISGLIAISSIWPAFKKHHSQGLPIVLMLTGFITIITGKSFGHHYEIFFSPLGALLIAMAHGVNWRYLKKHHSCKTSQNVSQ
ncbi:MerC domain-containing protein [Rapidithrix thailandica]|uniref:MerC domain-containing protein n=1 Tax=Rapidithrix thailandica TaxID=413964 RepID=A0AAW9RR80_9BACT